MTKGAGSLLALALVSAFVLRLPALRFGVISDDEAIYDAMAQSIARGGVMYRDTVDHKPPGLAYTYAACHGLARRLGPRADEGALSMALVHLIGALAAAATALAIFAVGRLVLVDPRDAALAALLYAAISVAKQPVDGLAVNGELLMNLPVVLALAAALRASSLPDGAARWRVVAARLLDVVAGALLAVAALYKYQAAGAGLALPLLLAVGVGVGAGRSGTRSTARRVARAGARAVAWTVGFALPLALVARAFRSAGALDDALFWGIRFNREYLGQGPGALFALSRLAMQVPGVILPGIALYAGAALGARSLRSGDPDASVRPGRRAFLGAWALVSVACVGLGARFFGHYFLQAEPPLALLAAAPVRRLVERAPRRAWLLALPPLAFAALALAPSLATRLFHAGDPDAHAIGRAVREATPPSGTIWVWGNVPQIYFEAERAPGVRFTFCNYLTGLSPATPSEYDARVDPTSQAVPGALALALADLARNRPAVVVDTAEHDLKRYGRFPLARFPALAAFVEAHYERGATVAGAVLYRARTP